MQKRNSPQRATGGRIEANNGSRLRRPSVSLEGRSGGRLGVLLSYVAVAITKSLAYDRLHRPVRIFVVPVLIVLGLLLIALLLPSRRDTGIAVWWARVRYQMIVIVRLALALACAAGIVWFVVLPLFGWR